MPVCLTLLVHVPGVVPHGVVRLPVTPRVRLAQEVQIQSCTPIGVTAHATYLHNVVTTEPVMTGELARLSHAT
jgi:hypothetical protein